MKTETKPQTDRHCVMIVEDDAEFRSIVWHWLLPDYDTVTFGDGIELLASEQERVPSLIIMDVQLPGPNGFLLCQRVHEQARFANVPVLFLTGVDSDEGFLMGMDAGGASYLTKPVERADLLARVRELVDVQADRMAN